MHAFLFDLGTPVRRKATSDEIADVLKGVVNLVVIKHHRGRPPRKMGWDDLKQEISIRTIRRLERFQHGGKFPLQNYAYFAAYCALKDIQREEMRQSAAVIESLPLLDYIERIA
jgi:hypothetical protein